ncbi:MAG: hypothetical protein M0Q92_07330 [Methanoregula sp.]|jgi:hypothetical protein|nr:hypothetical protein [Methanoregula sp.]
MKPDRINHLGNKIYRGFGNKFVVAALLIIFLLFGGLVLFGYYHAWVIAPRECCVEFTDPVTHTEYGFYSVNDFIHGNDLFLEPDGRMRAGYTDDDDLNITWSERNWTWTITNSPNDTIPFRIYNPATDATVEGIYTPNTTLSPDTLSTDILRVNWNDTEYRGSCYSVYAAVTPTEYGYDWVYNSKVDNVRVLLNVSRYDEFRVNIPLPDAFQNNTARVDLTYPRVREHVVISEKNCSVEDYPTKGSWTIMLLSLKNDNTRS